MADLDKTKGELAQTNDKNTALQKKISELEGHIAEIDAQLSALTSASGSKDHELQELRAAKAEREKELEVYRAMFKNLKSLIDSGDIQVVFRKGRMIIQLRSAVLFDSGSTELKDEGKGSLSQLVKSLESFKNRDFMVAGHTDNVPIRSRKFKSNWDLSAARAVTVVQYMIEQGFPQEHLGAAGYAEVDPVASNDDEPGRQSNRRIEVIMMPRQEDIKGLRELIEKKGG